MIFVNFLGKSWTTSKKSYEMIWVFLGKYLEMIKIVLGNYHVIFRILSWNSYDIIIVFILFGKSSEIMLFAYKYLEVLRNWLGLF